MLLSPLVSFDFPQVTPGSHKSLGYAYIRSPPVTPYIRATPIFKENSQPALKIEEVAYSVYYPCAVPSRGWFGGPSRATQWLPEPVGETVAGYERFLGKRGAGWICESTATRYEEGCMLMMSSKSPNSSRRSLESTPTSKGS